MAERGESARIMVPICVPFVTGRVAKLVWDSVRGKRKWRFKDGDEMENV